MYHVIERPFGPTTQIEIDGLDYPVPSVVADDDDGRILLHPGPEIPTEVWARALAAGCAAVVDVQTGSFALSEVFTEHREENAVRSTLALPRRFWTVYAPGASVATMALADPNEVALVAALDAEVSEDATGFVHLHTHAEYSGLDGLSKLPEMIERVTADGQRALALTDHGTCAGHPVLAAECEKAGIKPIFGMEAYFVDDRSDRESRDYYHLVLWAMNDEGLRNLWAMSTESFVSGQFYKPRVDWELLERFGEGLLCSTACLRGPLAHPVLRNDGADDDGIERAMINLARLRKIFPDRLYFELHANTLPQQKIINEWSVELADEYGIPLLAVVDSHYADRDDKLAHRVWLSIQTNHDIADDNTGLFEGNQDYHLMPQDEVWKNLSYLDTDVVETAIANTVRLANRCTARMETTAPNPVFSRSSAEWPDPVEHDVERLFELCQQRWDERTRGTGFKQSEYLARFEREITLIIQKGFAGYFLMVADFVNWAKNHEILVGPGRGSGGGSLVAYLCRITEIDPVASDLLFERFMTEGRTALPDFDIDFPSSQKSPLLTYLAERWGAAHIATVGTQLRLKSKGVVNDVARAMKSTLPDEAYPDMKDVAKIIDEAERGSAGLGVPWDELWEEHAEILDPYREKYPDLFAMCDKLYGRMKTYGTHPAGVIIDPDRELAGRLPLRNGENGMVTQWDMDALERIAVKFDLLNLRTLDTLQKCLELVKETTGEWIDIYSWREQYEDPQIYDEIGEGWTLGIFQIETQSGTGMARRFQPESLAELADVITLVRPGPVRSGLTETYFRRRNGDEEVYVPDPRLEPVLAKTYGCMVYQEDIMAVCMVLAGYGSDEADTVRRILGKKKVEAVQAEGEKFVSRAVANGTDMGVAVELWEQMAEFAKYSFNRAHAFAYAVLGIWTAWLKFHYPVQFLTAALSTVKDERIPEFVEEARRLGYKILPPDINESGKGFTATPDAVRYGLLAVKHVGEAAVGEILKARETGPFESFQDFQERLGHKGSKCNSGHVKKLIHIGAFDSLEPNRRGLEGHLEAREFVEKGTDACRFKTSDERPVYWIETRATEKSEHVVQLPCSYDWPSEPDTLGRTNKPLKRKAPPKRCTRACRRFSPAEPMAVDDFPAYTAREIRTIEIELLGVFLSSTPFDVIEPSEREELSTAMDVLTGSRGTYLMASWIKNVRQKPGGDRYGRPMGWVTLMTERGELEAVVFASVFEVYADYLNPNTLVLVAVKKDSRSQQLVAVESIPQED